MIQLTKDWVIRQFQEHDLESVVEINRQCLPENYPDRFFLGLHYHAPKAFLVAEKEDAIVGYIMCRIERGISSFGRLPTKKGHIVSVAVLPEFRHQGIGSDLVEQGIDGMIDYGASEFFLEVRKANKSAISMYENFGFELKRVLKGYYRDGEDAYLMVMGLDESSEEDSD
ncbi:ribosomal-protein-alanine N-acetyltransferase [Candidatus Thorarchaeota archaeon]|jgi:ribosomal-protein-alanine N-acetyltransferase|nr:MAG: ribosomal-protein-alanine N-acetyltransferase [Candidatus Thorarchaeota archaeon]